MNLMPYQEHLGDAKWIAVFDGDWQGEPWKSDPKEDAPAILAAPIPSATYNTLRIQMTQANLTDDTDTLTAVRHSILKSGVRGWRNIKGEGKDDSPIAFEKARRHDGPSDSCIAELEGRGGITSHYLMGAALAFNGITRAEAGN